jgi:hypothetical protein
MLIRKNTNRSHTMTRVKKLTLAALMALALTAGAVAAPSTVELAGDPSQWGIDSVAKKGSFDSTPSEDGAAQVAKVNEYEGQHRVA